MAADPRTSTTTIGLAGWGRMGGPMGRRLIAAGHDVTAFDLAPAARGDAQSGGATLAGTCRELASAADVIITMLPHGPAVSAATDGPDGLLAGLRPGSLWLEMTSSDPEVTAGLSKRAEELSVDFLDAPVTGGVPKAASGNLTVIAAGSDTAFSRAARFLDVLAAKVFRVGEHPGLGDVAKTVNNLLSAANLALAAEGLALAVRCGVPPSAMLDVLNAGTGRSNATEWKIPQYVLTGAFNSGFTMSQYLKDLRIAMAVAEREGMQLLLARTVTDVWSDLTERSGDSADHTEVVRVVAESSHVDLTV